MKILEDGCELTPSFIQAVSDGLAVFGANEATVLATVDFGAIVAELTGDGTYTTDRGGGVVAAKTIPTPNGPTIVLNHPEISQRPMADVTRLLAHESGHVVINARETEETAGNRDASDSEWQWILKCLGALAITELRIERGLAEMGFLPAESATSAYTEWNLRILNAEVIKAICDPASQDVLVFRDAILTTLNHFTNHLAYLAAPLLSGRPAFQVSEMSVRGQQNWNDYVGDVWDEKLRFWGDIPPVTQPIQVSAWRDILRWSVDVEHAQMEALGFRFEGVAGDGYAFRRTIPDNRVEERIAREQAYSD